MSDLYISLLPVIVPGGIIGIVIAYALIGRLREKRRVRMRQHRAGILASLKESGRPILYDPELLRQGIHPDWYYEGMRAASRSDNAENGEIAVVIPVEKR